MLLGVQRNMLLQVCCAYRRVSGEVLCALAKRRKNEREREPRSAFSGACKGKARDAHWSWEFWIGKFDCAACWYYEEGVEENLEHAIFECDRWTRVREECEMEVSKKVNVDNMIELMSKDEDINRKDASAHNKKEIQVQQ